MPTILLPARCDRAATEVLLPAFQAAQGLIEIDASQTEHIGQAMLQLLISARMSAAGARITPSQALIEVARLTGLDQILLHGERP